MQVQLYIRPGASVGWACAQLELEDEKDFHENITATMGAINEAKVKMIQLQSENEDVAE